MSSEETYSADQVNQLLTCPVCLDRYNSPKILPCQHTVCRSPCMEGLIDRFTRMIKCPTCRAEHFVPRTGVDGFPTNITISGFLDLQAQATTARSDSDVPAAQAVAAADPEETGGASGGAPKKCAVCENEADTVKCFHCSKMVCASCKQSHTGQMKMDVGRLVNQIRRSLPKLSNCISSVEHRGEVIKQHVTGVKSEVSTTIERFIKELKEREKLLHSELDTFQQGEMRSLRLHQETIEVELASISSYCDSMENFLNTNGNVPEADLVNIKHQCSEYMQQVRNIENEPMPPMRRSKFLAIEDSLQMEITHFGRIDIPPSLTITAPPATNVSPSHQPSGANRGARGGQQRARWGDRSPRVPGGTQPGPTAIRRPPAPRQHTTPRRFSPPPTQNYTAGESSPVVTTIGGQPPLFMEDRSLIGPFGRPSSPPAFNTGPARSDDSWLRSSPGGGAYHSSPRSIYLPSRHEDYMYQMNTGGDDVFAVLEEMRRQDEWELNASIRETARIRNNQQNVNVLGTPTPRSRSTPNPQTERTGGMMGGGGGGGVVANTSSSSNRGRGRGARAGTTVTRTTRSSNNGNEPLTRINDETMRELEDEIHNMEVDGAGNSNNANPANQVSTTSGRANQASTTPGRANQNNGNQPGRAAAAAAIARSSQNTGNNSNANEGNAAANQNTPNNRTATNQTAPNSRTANQTAPNNRLTGPGNNTNRTGNQASTRGGGTNTQTRRNQPANRNAPSNRNATNGATNPTPSTSNGGNTNNNAQRRNSNNSTASSTDTNNSGNTDSTSTRPRRISQQAPQNIVRSRTFVQEEPTTVEQPEDLPSVSNNGLSFSIALDDADTNEQSPATTGYNMNYREKSTAVLCIGSGRGNGRDNFTWPRGVAVSPLDGSVVVADSSNHRVKVYNTNGTLASTFGSYGTNEGEFDCLAGIAVNTMGNIIIADRYNHRIQVLDKTGRFLHAFGSEGPEEGQLSYPWGVAVDGSGFIYVCDKENHRIQVFQQNGTFVRKFGGLGSQPSKLENPHYLAVTSDNKVIVSDSSNHRLQVFTNTGRFIKTIASQGTANGQLKYPKGIAVDPNGYIIVADSGNSRVQIFQPNGRYHCHFGSSGTQTGSFRGLEGLGLSSNGTIVVSDKDNHRIQTF